jgi:hypothetical protein
LATSKRGNKKAMTASEIIQAFANISLPVDPIFKSEVMKQCAITHVQLLGLTKEEKEKLIIDILNTKI